jgi:hypothetical protein
MIEAINRCRHHGLAMLSRRLHYCEITSDHSFGPWHTTRKCDICVVLPAAVSFVWFLLSVDDGLQAKSFKVRTGTDDQR